MKGVQAKDLRENEAEELNRTLAKLRNDLFQHRLKRSTNQLENTMLIRNTRRDIARIHTVLAEQSKASAPAGRAPAGKKPAPASKKKARAAAPKAAPAEKEK
jgi:large subunit ribosomal protein L29